MDTSQSAAAPESMYTPEPAAELPPLDQARRAFEHGYLVHVLTLAAGNVTHAARYARRNRTEFYRLLRRHGLSPANFKRAAGFKRRLAP